MIDDSHNTESGCLEALGTQFPAGCSSGSGAAGSCLEAGEIP
jgi:hypothetical protein